LTDSRRHRWRELGEVSEAQLLLDTGDGGDRILEAVLAELAMFDFFELVGQFPQPLFRASMCSRFARNQLRTPIARHRSPSGRRRLRQRSNGRSCTESVGLA